jgi:hypothetical protein
VTHHAPQEMLRLAEDELTADAAIAMLSASFATSTRRLRARQAVAGEVVLRGESPPPRRDRGVLSNEQLLAIAFLH